LESTKKSRSDDINASEIYGYAGLCLKRRFSFSELHLSSKAEAGSAHDLALQKIAPLIHEVRGERVILDSDLARIYGVTTKRLNEQVKRNSERFPDDFMFQLTIEDGKSLQASESRFATASLRSQIATSSLHGGRRYLPYAFTEHGAIMAANVLNSKEAVQMSVFVVRAFVKLRETLATQKELAGKLTELERKVGTHDKAIVSIIAAIRALTKSPKMKPRAIGFQAKREGQSGDDPKTTRAARTEKVDVTLLR
jgi:hypothetical protein